MNVSWQINGTEVQFNESVTGAYYTNTSATLGTWNVSAIASNPNGTDMQTWWWTVKDVTPLASISNLHNTTYAPIYINWSWTNPADGDFNHTMVYINGLWEENVSSLLNYYNATGLSPNTNNTISTRTVDTSGDVNQTWVNHSAWTQAGPDTTPATVDFDPDTLNKKSKGKWVTVYTELPAGYNVTDINVSTMMLNETVPAELQPTEIGDYDSDGIPDLMVKFDRQAVIDILSIGDAVDITVTGKLYDETPFEGSDVIRVIDKGKGK